MKKAVLFALVLGWTPLAWPAAWISLGGNHPGSLAIDADSIVRRGESVQYWLRRTLPAPALDAATGRLYQRLEVLRHLNCRTHAAAIEREQVYAPDGGLISSQAEPNASRLAYRPIRPHTMGAAEMRYVCRRQAAA